MNRWIYLALIALLLAACGPGAVAATASPEAPAASETPSPPATTTPTLPPSPTATAAIQSAYLMAFHACDLATAENCNFPDSHEVYLAQSDDGVSWSLVPGWQPYSGSVPDVVRRGNTLYIYSAGRNQFVRYHMDTQRADPPGPLKVSDLSFGLVDPSPMLDEQGRIVLFFLPGLQGADPAGCGPEAGCTREILSAVEVEGSNGSEFELVEGLRASYEIDASSDLKSFSDPDIFFDGQQYVLYVSHGPSISVWTSQTLDGEFTQLASLPASLLTLGNGGVPAGHFDPASGLYWTYAHVDVNGQTVIRLAQHPDFSRRLETSDFQVVLSGELLGLGDSFIVASPGFTVNQP